jgi:hypothetical protein
MTELTLRLDELIEAKFHSGFTVPVHIDLSDFLEYGDDDWGLTVPLEKLCDESNAAPFLFSAADVKERRPDLSDEQALEVARTCRDDFVRDRVHLDILESTADALYPTARGKAFARVFALKLRIRERLKTMNSDEPRFRESAERLRTLLQELAGIERIVAKLPDRITGDPAAQGAVAVALDDLEAALNQEGGTS